MPAFENHFVRRYASVVATICIGISGWRYAGWRGHFYPEDLTQAHELEFASRQFPSIELNGSFYSLQRVSSYQRWYAETPPSFTFAIKGSRFITHTRRLREIEAPLANFFASGILALKEKLGPFLWQFPPNMKFDEERFAHFFSILPRDTQAAAELALYHDHRLSGDRVWAQTDKNRPVRHAVEIRNDTFLDPAFVRLLRKNKIALVFSDAAGEWPYAEDVTADFLYLRLHGAEERYVSGYTDDSLDDWARKISKWHHGTEPSNARKIADLKPPNHNHRDVFVYFDNDAKVKAPGDAQKLMARLNVPTPADSPESPPQKRRPPRRKPGQQKSLHKRRPRQADPPR